VSPKKSSPKKAAKVEDEIKYDEEEKSEEIKNDWGNFLKNRKSDILDESTEKNNDETHFNSDTEEEKDLILNWQIKDDKKK